MGKFTQAWQADDGQFFGTEEQMLAHEQQTYLNDLEANWDTFARSFLHYEGYGEYTIDTSLNTTSSEVIEKVIKHLTLTLEQRPK